MVVPPNIRRPTIRLAYCTGIRRCDNSTKMTPAITSRPNAITSRKTIQPWEPGRATFKLHSALGKVAAIWVKIRTDMPLPTPRSVMSSPSHMITPVPAVIVRIMTTGKMLCRRPVRHPVKSRSFTATVTKAVELSTASTRVR